MMLPDKLINKFRTAQGLPEKPLMIRTVKVLGWNYTLDLKDNDGNDVVIFLAEQHSIGESILDFRFTGQTGEILRREAVVEK